jgi:hypothetical protein
MGAVAGLWPAGRSAVRLRPWTFRLKPLPDELLSSWLTRVAFAHGQNPYVFHNLHLPSMPIWSRDVDRAHVGGLLSGLSAVSALSVSRIRAASLDRYRDLGLTAPVHGEWPFILSAGIYHRKRRRHGLQFCPNCLGAGTAYFRRSWRLAYVLKCPTCNVPLSDACPHCDAPVIPHRTHFDMRACHRCGGDICSDSVRTENALRLSDGGIQELMTRATSRRAVSWLGRRLRPSEALQVAAALIRLVPASRIDGCRSAIGLPACPVPMRSGRLERQRLSDRALRLETIGRWASEWPRTFRLGASALGLTRRSFVGIRLPPELAGEVARLPKGKTHTRSERPLLLGPDLRAIRRGSVTAYRQIRAERILKAAGPR